MGLSTFLEDLQTHVYQIMTDDDLTTQHALIELLVVVDAWVGDYPESDASLFWRRCVSEAFYGPDRPRSISRTVHAMS